MSDTLKVLKLSQIRENKTALREVDRETESYANLVESIRTNGVFMAIVVRPQLDNGQPVVENGEELYDLVDGLHRYTASGDAGRQTIPANVMDISDAEIFETQIICNVQKIDTKPADFSKHLHRMLVNNPMMTMSELGAKISKSSTWISERLSLLKLTEGIQSLLDDNKIPLSNAYALSKLPEDEQDNFKERAMTMSSDQFVPACLDRKRDIEKASRQGKKVEKEEFKAQPYLQKLKDVQAEVTDGKISAVLLAKGRFDLITDPKEAATKAFRLACQWFQHLDPESVSEQERAHEQRKASSESKKEGTSKERIEKKQAEAALKLARLQVEAKAIEAGTSVNDALKSFDDENGLVNGKKPAAPKAEKPEVDKTANVLTAFAPAKVEAPAEAAVAG